MSGLTFIEIEQRIEEIDELLVNRDLSERDAEELLHEQMELNEHLEGLLLWP